MNKFRWAYVGNGMIAQTTAYNIALGKHTVSHVYGRNAKKVKLFGLLHGAKPCKTYEELLLGDSDAIYIATPHTSHKEYALKALAAGKPVLCEKPIAVTEADAAEMIAAAKEHGTYFCEAMWTWFAPVAKQVKKWVSEGAVGEVQDVVIHYGYNGLGKDPSSRVRDPNTAGGCLLDIGIYALTYCYNLFGYPEDISCQGTLEDGIDIREEITLSYPGFKAHLSVYFDRNDEFCTITGTKGTIHLPMFHMAAHGRLKAGLRSRMVFGLTEYLHEFNAVAKEIQAGKTESDVIPFEATLAVMRMMDECRRQMGLKYPFE